MAGVTWDTGGPGRRKCVCGVYAAARARECPKCGAKFASKIDEARAQSKSIGMSRAAAVADGQDDGPVRSKIDDAKPKVVRPQLQIVVRRQKDLDLGNVLTTPSGSCPVELEGDDLEAVTAWAQKLQDKTVGLVLGKDALKYWTRHVHRVGTKSYKTVIALLDSVDIVYAKTGAVPARKPTETAEAEAVGLP